MSSVSQQVIEMPSHPAAMEQHFSVAQLAQRWSVSEDTIRRLFEHEAGVLVIEPPRSRFSRRRYRTLRIPASIAERVHRRLSVVNERGKR
jgi:transcriptional regulator GlxA family with amidase domain